MSDIIQFETRGRMAIITLNRPEARNAVNGEFALGLEAAIDRFEADDDLWVGILAANTEGQSNPVFSAGADLKVTGSGKGGPITTERGWFAGFVYRERTKPIIAAVDGLATAGGCEIVLACDIIVATTRSAFGLAEARRNLIAAGGGLFRLPRAVGQVPAMAAALTGEPIPAPRAYELGMISHLVEPGHALDEAIDVAEAVLRCAPQSVRESRQIILAAPNESEETLKRMADDAVAAVNASEDLKEGIAAFIEKREPRWTGR